MKPRRADDPVVLQTEADSAENEATIELSPLDRYRLIAEFTYDWEYWIGPDKKLQYTSPSCVRITGYAPDEFYADPDLLINIVHPEDRERIRQHIQNPERDDEIPQIEFRVLHKDGSERWIGHICREIFDDRGRSLGRRGTNRDITDQRLTQRNLWESRKVLRTVLNHTHMLVAYLDRDFNFVMVNQAYASKDGASPEQFEGKNHFDLYPNKENEEIFRQVVLSGKPYFAYAKPFEYDEHPERGTTYWDWSLVPIEDDNGQVQRLVLTLVEVTERIQASRKMQELNETLEQRVADRTQQVQRQANQLRALAAELVRVEQRERKRLGRILHDHLQQLLVAAQLQLELIRRDAVGEKSQRAIGDVTSILRDAIQSSRSLAVELSPPILHEAGLSGGLSWLAGQFESKHKFRVEVTVADSAEPDSEEIRFLLFECVRELLLNSIKHSGVQDAKVSLEADAEGWIHVCVEDHGTGFDIDSVMSSSEGGGFGLFSIQQRLAHFAGTMEVCSEAEQGTRILLSIPSGLEVRAEAANRSEKPAERLPQGEKRRRVVLVDDHIILREGLSILLDAEGDLEVIGQAGTAEEGIFMAKKLNPDIVVMDVNLPDKNGIEATRILVEQMPHIHVIGLSMHIDRDIAEAMTEAGAVAYLSKGGPVEDLVETIRKA